MLGACLASEAVDAATSALALGIFGGSGMHRIVGSAVPEGYREKHPLARKSAADVSPATSKEETPKATTHAEVEDKVRSWPVAHSTVVRKK
jgi:hypothetical protein